MCFYVSSSFACSDLQQKGCDDVVAWLGSNGDMPTELHIPYWDSDLPAQVSFVPLHTWSKNALQAEQAALQAEQSARHESYGPVRSSRGSTASGSAGEVAPYSYIPPKTSRGGWMPKFITLALKVVNNDISGALTYIDGIHGNQRSSFFATLWARATQHYDQHGSYDGEFDNV